MTRTWVFSGLDVQMRDLLEFEKTNLLQGRPEKIFGRFASVASARSLADCPLTSPFDFPR